MGRGKKASLQYIKERVWSKIRGWKEKLLSQAGREVLLKAVVQAIPTYSMSCFKLPNSLCHEIEVMVRKFWWDQRGERRKVHWIKWSKLCKPKNEGGMGFRDLQKFNNALLAKQVWRLMSNQDSLFGRFFKSKFFPQGTIFDAKENRGSFAWKSILKGRDTIKKGMKWRIADGRSVRIFKDHWLPHQNHGRVLSPIGVHCPETRVSSLIDEDLWCWKVDVIDQMFLPFEANMVKAIPLGLNRTSDTIFWPKTRNGMYSVQTGYKLLMESDEIDGEGPSDSGVRKTVWKKIWQLQVPNRVRSLMWRAGSNSLPTKTNLFRQKLVSDSCCSNCKMDPEDTLHALWSCPSLTPIWQVQFAELMRATGSVSSFLDVIQLAQNDTGHVDLFAMMISFIWIRRNKSRTEETVFELEKIPALARDSLQEFQQLRPIHAAIRRTARSVRWRPPPSGMVKVNFDGALFPTKNIAGLGIIVRNNLGQVMAALSQQIPLPTSVEMVEVQAARRALLFSRELGFERLIIEGDLELIINAITGGEAMFTSEFGHILQDIHSLESSFQSVSFQHVRRLGNCVAHRLARRSICNSFLVWMEDVPPDIAEAYNYDLS